MQLEILVNSEILYDVSLLRLRLLTFDGFRLSFYSGIMEFGYMSRKPFSGFFIYKLLPASAAFTKSEVESAVPSNKQAKLGRIFLLCH